MTNKEFIDRFPGSKEDDGTLTGYFGYMLQNDFIDILTDMSNEMPQSTEYYGYYFANNCDPDDPDEGDIFEDGVMFFEHKIDVIVKYEVFYAFLKIACDIYLEEHIKDKNIVNECLEKIKHRYKI